MAITDVTLKTGRTLQIDGNYDDLRLYLTTGQQREVTLTDGRKLTLATDLVGLIEQGTEKRALGFR